MTPVKKDPNLFSVEDYFDLKPQDRNLLDDWLKSIGGHPEKTQSLIIDRQAHKITAVEWILEKHSKSYTDSTIVGTEEIIYAYEEEPPVWKVS